MEAQIVSSKIIKPSKPTPLRLRNYKLSFSDQFSNFSAPGIIYFFLPDPKHSDDQTEKQSNEKCNQLEKSLAETLTRYYPLAGRYYRDDFLVDCSDQGVEVSRARVDKNLGDILHRERSSGLEISLDKLAPDPDVFFETVPCPLISVQITLFNCGGIAIGTRTLHTICDGYSVVEFMNDWGKINRQGVVEKQDNPVSYKLSSLLPARDSVDLKHRSFKTTATNKLVTRNFLFDSAMISTLKAEATSPASGAQTIREPSRVLLLIAHIWRTLICITKAKHGKPMPSQLSTWMNLRGRLQIQENENHLFGTFVAPATAYYAINEKNMMEICDFVSLLRNTIKTTEAAFSRSQNADEIYYALVQGYNELYTDKIDNADHWVVTSWCGFPIHNIDFGWGKLSWLARASIPYKMIHLVNADCGGDAIEAWMSLSEDDMIEFERHYQDQRNSIGKIYSRF